MHESKPALRSVTIWGLIIILAGVLLQGSGPEGLLAALVSPETGDMLGQLLSLLGVGVAGAGRVRKGGGKPLHLRGGRGGAGGPAGGSGAVLGVLLASLVFSGCCLGPRQVVAQEKVHLAVQEGPPCVLVLTVDGEVVQRVESSPGVPCTGMSPSQ